MLSCLHLKACGGDLGEAVLKHVLLHLSVVLGGLLGAAREAAPVVPLIISVQALVPMRAFISKLL